MKYLTITKRMPITHVIDGEEVTLYTPEEVEAINAEKARLEAENADLQKVSREKTEHFKKLNQMTEQEKEQFTARELENRAMLEKLMEEKEALEQKLTEKEKNEIESTRNKIISEIVGTDEELKNKFLEQYSIVNIEEKDADSMRKRAESAAKLAGIEMPGTSYNPIHQMWSGDSPRPLKGDTQEFLQSDRAKKALEAMGDVVE